MPLTLKQLLGIQQGASGGVNPYAQANIQAQAGASNRQAAMDAIQSPDSPLARYLKQGRDVSFDPSTGDVKVGSNLGNVMKQQAMADKQEQEQAGETDKIQKLMHEAVGKDVDKLKGGQAALNILKDPSIANMTLLRDALAREAIGGRVPQQMVDKILGPKPYSESLKEWWGGKVLGNPNSNPLSDEQRKAYMNAVQLEGAGASENVAKFLDQLQANSPQQFPKLSKSGKIQDVLNNVRQSAGGFLQQASPQQSEGQSAPTARQKRIAELKAKLGK